MKARAVCRAFLFTAAASSVSTGSIAAEGVSFSNDLVPVLKKRCAICHLTGAEAGNMALHPRAAYGYLVDVPSVQAPELMRVAPAEPEKSYLLMKLEGSHLDAGGTGTTMPFNEPPLDAATIDQFRQWIAAGAPEN